MKLLMDRRLVLVLMVYFNCAGFLNAQNYLQREDQWVQSTIDNMTTEQKVGQLFMIRAYSRGSFAEEKIILNFIKTYHIGGICFFQGSPLGQIALINKYQSKSKIPLFVGMDGEWGLGMRFPKETISFPKQLMLGAIQDNKLIYEMGREIARQCKRAGININFAPSIDINNNPNNPVIFDRSFGELPKNVTAKGYMYMRAMEDEGIMSCIKHFPGHGDTNVDSHHDLPILNHDRERLEKVEFYPFRRLASQGAGGIMVGHMHMPALDPRPNMPTSLSNIVIKDILRKDIGFNGLVFTDAMDMKGITKYFPNGVAEAEAFLAGNDVILLPENLEIAYKTIMTYISIGDISLKRLDESVTRILRAKYRIGLNVTPVLSEDGILKYLNRNQAIAIKEQLTEAAITLVSDNSNIVPFVETANIRFGTLSINVNSKTDFQKRIDSYCEARHYQLMPNELKYRDNQLLQTLSQFENVIVAIHTSGKLNDFSKDVNSDLIEFLKVLDSKCNMVLALFGSPYLLTKLTDLENILLCYDNDEITQDIAAQALFGVNTINGLLPVGIGKKWDAGYGLTRGSLGRLGYALPERVNMNSDTLMMIDSIMDQMVKIHAAPGGQVLVAKDGKIIFEKAYGKLTDNGYYVSNNTIYDVASITKVLATTISTMKLVDQKKLNVNNPIKNYISGLDTTGKADLVLADLMAHFGKLTPWIPFYEKTLQPKKSFGYNPTYYSGMLFEDYTVPIAKGLFMRSDYRDTIWHTILNSELRQKHGYKYSDLGFYILQRIVENESHKKLDKFAFEQFYGPLGLRYTQFKPLENHNVAEIAPTEIDNYIRHQTLQGNVHDMGAAMLGGVGGHAGLFSNAHDMGVLMQMLLNKGSYGGRRYLLPETINRFTQRHPYSTRRALGFDMKELDPTKSLNMSPLASESTFGHIGFTGTAAYADPENNLVYIFCSNRTYPSRLNQTFSNRDYRSQVQTIIYKALRGYTPNVYL